MRSDSLDIALESFFEVRNLTYEFLFTIDENVLGLNIPRTSIKTVSEQIAEMAVVSIQFSISIKTRFLTFDNQSWVFSERLLNSKKALIDFLHRSDKIISDNFKFNRENITLIDIYGQMKPPFDIVIGMIEHETLHIGQLSLLLHYNEIPLPKKWKEWMMCENISTIKSGETIVEEIILFQKEEYAKYENIEYAAKEKKYTKSNLLFWGVKKDIINSVAQKIKNKWGHIENDVLRNLFEKLWRSAYHEERTLAIVLSYKFIKKIDSRYIAIFKMWLKQAASWGQVDELCIKTIGVIAFNEQTVFDEIYNWRNSNYLWVKRGSLLSHLHSIRIKKPKIIMILKTCLHLLTEKDFFIQKAIGWTLRELSSYNPSIVEKFVTKYSINMSRIAIKEATRKLKK